MCFVEKNRDFLQKGVVSWELEKAIEQNPPDPSASLSELEPLLSEEDIVFLEGATDSTVFSATKTTLY